MDQVKPLNSISATIESPLHWTSVSAMLLVIYLGFFHLCIGSNPVACIVLGILFWVAWVGVCYFNRVCFKSRFEYWIHQFVGLDILLEGFNPYHEGFGFYWCATSFWAVLVAYHFLTPGNSNGASLVAPGD